uniref:Ig-like domain-containing protein n=1 Tax=Falco tinnunculus TaxID=100819 RepID=A0A8C4UF70_FALTI
VWILPLFSFLFFFFFSSAPPIFTKKPHPVQTLKGSDIHLECELQGTPPFQISWYKDKREIRSSKKYKIMSENYLTSIHILSVDTADVGEYHCKAVNDVGSDSCIGSVTLRGLYEDWHLLGISLFLWHNIVAYEKDLNESSSMCLTINLSIFSGGIGADC